MWKIGYRETRPKVGADPPTDSRHSKARAFRSFANCSQFHQHFTSSFCADFLLPKKLQTQIISTLKLRQTLLHKKAAHKMLLKLTPDLVEDFLKEAGTRHFDSSSLSLLDHFV